MDLIELDDTSDYIQYNGNWTDASPNDRIDPATGAPKSLDTDAQGRYRNGTWHHSEFNGATATISWVGGDVSVYGGKRFNHGWYSIQLDNQAKLYFNGLGVPDAFQDLLFTSSALQNGTHNIVLTNEPMYNSTAEYYKYVDIDFIRLYGQPILPGGSAPIASSVTSSAPSSGISTLASSASSTSVTTDGIPTPSPTPDPSPTQFVAPGVITVAVNDNTGTPSLSTLPLFGPSLLLFWVLLAGLKYTFR